jgi:hypothetical protein
MSVLDDLLSGTPRDWVMAVFAPILTGIELAKGDVWLALAAGGVTVMVWANIAERLHVGGRGLRRVGNVAGLLGGLILFIDGMRWLIPYLRP